MGRTFGRCDWWLDDVCVEHRWLWLDIASPSHRDSATLVEPPLSKTRHVAYA